MRLPLVPLISLALGVGLGAAAHAQAPFPFSEPDPGSRPLCSKERTQLLGQQLEALEKLRTQGPEAIGKVCALIGMGSAFLGREPEMRSKLRDILGFDIDLERAEAQCRAGQDNIAGELDAMVGRLRAEILRCDDTI